MPQAPKTLQRYGLEWAFRLYSEPRRLWRRYLLLNPLYLSLLAAEALRLRDFSDVAPAPQQEVGFG
jgi:UDP-N-acetyl-D-mannosaminuronic acid transferase (WecB/TagA/CpsF family)